MNIYWFIQEMFAKSFYVWGTKTDLGNERQGPSTQETYTTLVREAGK